MRVPPYFTQNTRFLIIQQGQFTYLIDVPNWKVHFRIEGFPIGISKDEGLLLVGNQNDRESIAVSVFHLDTAKELSLKDVEANAFEPHQRMYFLKSKSFLKHEKERLYSTIIIFQDSFEEKHTQEFELGITCWSSNRPIFKILASPIIAINGRCESDWGGFDFAWIGDLHSSQIIYVHSLMEDAPMTVNYTASSKQLALIAGDGVHLVDVTKKTIQGEAKRVFAARPFNVHSVWHGELEKFDALAHCYLIKSNILLCNHSQHLPIRMIRHRYYFSIECFCLIFDAKPCFIP